VQDVESCIGRALSICISINVSLQPVIQLGRGFVALPARELESNEKILAIIDAWKATGILCEAKDDILDA